MLGGSEESHDRTAASDPWPSRQGQVALPAVQGEWMRAEPARRFGVRPYQITRGRKRLLNVLPGFFGAAASCEPAPAVDRRTPYADHRELTPEAMSWPGHSG